MDVALAVGNGTAAGLRSSSSEPRCPEDGQAAAHPHPTTARRVGTPNPCRINEAFASVAVHASHLLGLGQGILNPNGHPSHSDTPSARPVPAWRSHSYTKCVGAEPSMSRPRSAVAAERGAPLSSAAPAALARRPPRASRPLRFQAHAGAQDGRGVREPEASCAARLDRLPRFRRLGA